MGDYSHTWTSLNPSGIRSEGPDVFLQREYHPLIAQKASAFRTQHRQRDPAAATVDQINLVTHRTKPYAVEVKQAEIMQFLMGRRVSISVKCSKRPKSTI
jgi:hypothetical protein